MRGPSCHPDWPPAGRLRTLASTAPLAGALCHAVFRDPLRGSRRRVHSQQPQVEIRRAEQWPRVSARFSRTTAVVRASTAFGSGCTPAPVGPSSTLAAVRAGRSCRPDPAIRAVLPAKARLTDRDDFTTVVRRGRRSGRTLIVMHVLLPDTAESSSAGSDPAEVVDSVQVGDSQVGFVVSKAVGGSVVRHRVARRLRHLMRDRLVDAPEGSRIVVRALPGSAQADSISLGADIDRALRGALLSKPSSRSGNGSGRRAPRSSTLASSARTPEQVSAEQVSAEQVSAERPSSGRPSSGRATFGGASAEPTPSAQPASHIAAPDLPAVSSRS
jgi:ribonuclease P protein component